LLKSKTFFWRIRAQLRTAAVPMTTRGPLGKKFESYG